MMMMSRQHGPAAGDDVVRGSGFLLEVLETARLRGGISIGELIGRRGRIGIAFTLLVLCLPTLVPLPGPFGMVFGTCLAFVAVQMLYGADRIWLPGFIARRTVSLKVVETMVRLGRPWVLKLESWLIAGRLPFLTGKTARMVLALPILVLAVLISLPIPFGNTAPALAIILIAIALAERDGLVVIFSLFVAAGAGVVTYYLVTAAGNLLTWAF
ncbi:exopolysaccharide biosynthesis protein [Agrobacterium vitis]|uniref:Exopolysaccharide biosynthesis protein n=2 Tax=Agrobacterium vitis TaxID=373 RepID=A0AAE5AWT2_AGRVI|nr:exopolysaccharide biosynthesis protein [Allorhizobium sp. Av2]MUZ58495.1 exopolysaccharide biosynthesis protein [Agrobacterium vitis]MVA65812.1 exopolysaccharide biosynthesis protein [Agrobacterium vitis]MVA88167.1 exopolysaccharide biosynthesis protein [Agrobacterium vitis]